MQWVGELLGKAREFKVQFVKKYLTNLYELCVFASEHRMCRVFHINVTEPAEPPLTRYNVLATFFSTVASNSKAVA